MSRPLQLVLVSDWSVKVSRTRKRSASQAQGFGQCRRLIDGRHTSPTNDIFEGKTRNLQWGTDGHSGYSGGNAKPSGGGGGSKGGSGSSKGSFSQNKGGSKGHSLHGSSKSGGSKRNSKSHSVHGISKSKGHSKGHSHTHSVGSVKESKGSICIAAKALRMDTTIHVVSAIADIKLLLVLPNADTFLCLSCHCSVRSMLMFEPPLKK